MGKKPVLGLVGAFLAGVAVTGCQSTNQNKPWTPPATRTSAIRPGTATPQSNTPPAVATAGASGGAAAPGAGNGLANPNAFGSTPGIAPAGGVGGAGVTNAPGFQTNTQRPAATFVNNDPPPALPGGGAQMNLPAGAITPGAGAGQGGALSPRSALPPPPVDAFPGGQQPNIPVMQVSPGGGSSQITPPVRPATVTQYHEDGMNPAPAPFSTGGTAPPAPMPALGQLPTPNSNLPR